MNKKTEIRSSDIHGKGVFAIKYILKNEVFETSNVVVVPKHHELPRELQDYKFPFNPYNYCICMGIGSFFNHLEEPNAKIHSLDKTNKTKSFSALRDIDIGEEITLYYNEQFDLNDKEPEE